jgi:hypothetical protein
MERRTAEKDKQAMYNQEYLTPVKGYQDSSQQKSTTANFNSHEPFSFEKIIQRQKKAIKYCSANLNELLGSDIKFKSPANLVKVNPSTPARNDWDGSAFFEIVQEYDSAAKFMANKLNLDMTIRKDSLHGLKLRDDEMLKENNFYIQPSFEFSNPYRQEFYVEESYQQRHSYYRPQGGNNYPLGQSCSNSEDFRKRKRKNNVQLKILKSEFTKGDCWTKEKIFHMAQVTGLSESQVYKWCWDQKKKIEENESHYKHDSGKMNIEHQLRAALMDFGDDDFSMPSEYSKPSDSLVKRKPERQPFGPIHNNRF